MDLTQPEFLFIVFPVLFLIYLGTAVSKRKYVLLITSILGYVWFERLNVIPIALIIGANYILLAISHRKLQKEEPNTLVTIGALVLNIGVFIFFKVFSSENYLHSVLRGMASEFSFLVQYPLGLSFIIFQMMACYFDVDRKPDTYPSNPADYALYLMFFPKILMGPINRWPAFSKQINQIFLDTERIKAGIRRFILGFAKKVLIANQLAVISNAGFNLSEPTYTTSLSWIIILCYFFQIYYDFSGYVDMVLGVASILGINLPENFHKPYHSKSITEFWRRWHMTLTSWFRDYVFFPLEFSRKKLPFLIQPVNIFVIFILTGLWHGLNLNFLIWGAIQGIAIIIEATPVGRWLQRTPALIQRVYVILFVFISWVIFRSPGISYALKFMKNLFIYNAHPIPLPFNLSDPLPIINNSVYLLLLFCIIMLLPIDNWISQIEKSKEKFSFLRTPVPPFMKDVLYIGLLIVTLAFSASQTFVPSVYQQF